MGNPFIKESLDTRDIMDEEAAKSVRRAEELGVQQYEAFDEGRPVNCRKPLSDLTRKNKLQLFGQPQQETNPSPSYSPLRVTAHSFPDYIACQSRDGDLHDFFTHENQRCPPPGWQVTPGQEVRSSSLPD